MCALSIVGGGIGTHIVLDINEDLIYLIVGTMLVFISPIAIVKKGNEWMKFFIFTLSLIVGIKMLHDYFQI